MVYPLKIATSWMKVNSIATTPSFSNFLILSHQCCVVLYCFWDFTPVKKDYYAT